MRKTRIAAFILVWIPFLITSYMFGHSDSSQVTQYELTLKVETDRSCYRPGELVEVLGIVENSTENAVENASVGIQVVDPSNGTVFLDIVYSLSDGSYNDSFRLHLASQLGEYKAYVTASASGYSTVANQTSFSVADLRVHNFDTGLNYSTIQEAIDAPETLNGHTIFAEKGTYYELVVVNKTLSLLGEDSDTTIIDGNGTGTVVSMQRSNSLLTGFAIRNGSTGIRISPQSVGALENITIRQNLIADQTGSGISVFGSDNNRIVNNTVMNCWAGISLSVAASNIIRRNVIAHNTRGISSGLLIVMSYSLVSGWRNSIFENLITENACGINITNLEGEMIWHNNFLENTVQAYVLQQYQINVTNVWDDGIEGNYWSDHSLIDTNRDGISNIEYQIETSNIDRYPLMGMFSSFSTPVGCNVNVISNSTIEDFDYFESNGTIRLYVSNATSNQNIGFCRICIPHSLMNETYQVTINGMEPLYADYQIRNNETHTWIYFEYEHSTLEIVIVPELALQIITSLVIMAMTATTIAYRKRHCRSLPSA
jgi:parallel beta-helix repeat protein